jgi:glycosyltransferase EpsF
MFLGRRTDVNTLLMGFDVFAMPSLHEGFAIAALEAAASGLPLYLSDKIPKELSFATRSRFLPIDRPPEYWSEEILSSQNSKYDRVKGVEEVIKNGFDIRQNIQLLENIYQGDRPI